MMSQNELLATQRHHLDLAASTRRVSVAHPRTAVTTRIGHVLVEAGSRLLADRRTVAQLH